MRQYQVKYDSTHKELRSAIQNRRRVRKVSSGGSHTLKQWREKKALYGHRCWYCGEKKERLEREHLIPLSRGGTDDISNIVPACRRCNGKKGTMTADEYLATIHGQLKLAL